MEWIIFVGLIIASIIGLIFILNSLRKIRMNEEGEEKEKIKELGKIKAEEEKAKQEGREPKKETMAEAKKKAYQEEKARRDSARISIWWAEHFIIMGIITMSMVIIIEKLIPVRHAIAIWLISNLVINIFLLILSYMSVPEKHHFTVELLGHWFNTWHSGPHFRLPFFMKISGDVYMGDIMCTLYMDDKERNGEKDAVIEFTDASAGVITRLYYRVFSAHRAVYNIDNVQIAVREKLDAGLRAFLGTKKLDKVLAERADVNLQTILEQNATEAAIFKSWGVEIRTLAMTDVILDTNLIKTRGTIIIADKEWQESKIKVKTAKQKAMAEQITQRVAGTAIGEKIEQIMEKTNLSKEQVVSFLLTEGGLNAIKDNKGIFMGMGNDSAPQIGAEFAAGFSAVTESLKNTTNSSSEQKKLGKEDGKIKDNDEGGEEQ